MKTGVGIGGSIGEGFLRGNGDYTVARVPRIIVLARLMWRCSFCIFAVLAGDAVLMAVPQAREALQGALAPRANDTLGWAGISFRSWRRSSTVRCPRGW